MPSSGARSGTPPSRNDRGAGRGGMDPGPPMLRCGHQADSVDPVVVFPAQKKRYWCEECRSLVAAKK